MNQDQLFKELTNTKRRRILEALSNSNYSFTELSNKLNINSPELSRHIRRLQASKLIQKIQNEYSISPIGILVKRHMKSLEYITQNQDYLLNHDFSQIPECLLYSLYKLEKSRIIGSVYEMIELLESKFVSPIDFYYDLSDDFPVFLLDRVEKKIEEGTKFRVIYPESVLIEKIQQVPVSISEFVELKVLDDVCITVVLSDGFAFFGLPRLDGSMDRGFYYSEDEDFINWCNECFTYYWNKARTFHLSKFKMN